MWSPDAAGLADDPAIALAVARGQAAIATGALAEARALLEYASRRAPGDAEIGLRIGLLRLAQQDPEAVAAFAGLARGRDLREAWFGLVAALLMCGQPQEAAAALGEALSRHAPSRQEQVLDLFDRVAAEADSPGWCAVTGEGVLVAGRPPGSDEPAVALLDGRRLAIPEGRRVAVPLPAGWRAAGPLAVQAGERALTGSPIDLPRIGRVEGIVRATPDGIEGEARLPADPDAAPEITVIAGLAPPLRLKPGARGFRVARAELTDLAGPVHVLGADGRPLLGSPLDPAAWHRPVPAVSSDRRPPLAVVMPVHGGRREALAALDTVLGTVEASVAVIVVDDASPDPDLAAALERLAGEGRIRLIRRAVNGGFPAAANAGLRAAAKRDVVLLNSDTLVFPGWIERLQAAAWSAPNIGTATPLSNDATILSYPRRAGNPVPDIAAARHLADLAAAANGNSVVEIPTGVGFCLYVRTDCLEQTGLLREDAFAQGYGEENDFCLRARALGWRHVAAPGVFVAHTGGISFGTARAQLMACNLAVLNRLHPGYEAEIAAFEAADPLAPARRQLDLARWREGRLPGGAVLLITHARAGGVRRRVGERCAALRARGLRPIVLRPAPDACLVGEEDGEAFPNVRFALPAEFDALRDFLREQAPSAAELHHFAGHHPAVLDLPAELGIPADAFIHDYSWICPRIHLTSPSGRYCGEPDAAACRDCVSDAGSRIEEPIATPELRARSARQLGAARRVVAPSRDAASRLHRHFPALTPEVQPWEDAPVPAPATPPATGPVRVCLAGAIGIEKGYDLLLACARDAARRGLPLHFTLVGYGCDDRRLLETGAVTLTGPYAPEEAVPLIRAQRADLGFLPSVWPETWCYTLSELWAAGLNVAVLDLGAQAERVRDTGRGWVLPAGTAPALINDLLLLRAQEARDRAHNRPSETVAHGCPA